jgi:hypothetical protein
MKHFRNSLLLYAAVLSVVVLALVIGVNVHSASKSAVAALAWGPFPTPDDGDNMVAWGPFPLPDDGDNMIAWGPFPTPDDGDLTAA